MEDNKEIQIAFRTGLVSNINKARATYKIMDCTDLKIKQVLATCGAYVAVTNSPNEIETTVLIDFCRSYLGKYGVDEMTLAFSELANNTYTVEKDHFGKISPAYLKDVLDAYRAWRDGVLNKENRKKLEPPKPRNISDQESYEFIRGFCEKKNEIPIGANWSQAYNHMDASNILQLSGKEKQQIENKVIEKRGKLKEEDLKYYCKREAVIEHFELIHGITRNHLTI